MRKFLNLKKEKMDGEHDAKTGFQKKSIIKVITIIVLILLICLIIIMIPVVKNFFKNKIKESQIIENQITETTDNDIVEYYEVLNDGTKVNTSEEIENYEFELNGIKFSDIKITEKEGLTDLEIDYENTLNSDIEGFGVKLNFYNSKDELVYYYSVKLPDTIKVSEKDTIYTSILEKYAGIEYIEMEIDTEI